MYGIVIIIRNVIEHNREWINKCVLDKPRYVYVKLNGLRERGRGKERERERERVGRENESLIFQQLYLDYIRKVRWEVKDHAP